MRGGNIVFPWTNILSRDVVIRLLGAMSALADVENMMRAARFALASVIWAGLLVGPVAAQSIEAFYKGKRLTMLVGSGKRAPSRSAGTSAIPDRAACPDASSAAWASACPSTIRASSPTMRTSRHSKPNAECCSAPTLEMDATGQVILRSALPDSGTNHDTGMAVLIAEMLGISNIEDIKLMWGDSDVAPPTDQWNAGKTLTLQGGAALVAARKLRTELIARAGQKLGVAADTLDLKDGVIRSKADPRKSVAARDLLDGKSLRMHGQTKQIPQGRALAKGVGACFVEVEVDTWTGQFRVTRVVYSHDCGKVVNPLIAESDMEASFMQSFQVATNAMPYDREFPGQMHDNVAFLSYPIPTIMEFPDEINQIFIESLEPRWFYGYKSFSETGIGAVPGAIANAIYNATAVRVNHPITAERILTGLKKQRGVT
jgi:CO/xanthine dehydrogenase Mo-binding subunit